MMFRFIAMDPGNAPKWTKVRDGLGLLRTAMMGSIGLLLLLAGVGVYFVMQGGIPAMPEGPAFPDNPADSNMIVPLVIGGVLLLVMVGIGIMQMIGYWKCREAPEGSAARGWISACSTLSGISMLTALAAMAVPFVMSMNGSGMPPEMLAMVVVGLQIAGNISSLLANLMFVLFLRAIGQQFDDDGQVRIVNQMLMMIGMAILGGVAMAVMLGMNGGPGGAPGVTEIAIISVLGLLMLGSSIWYIRALGGARDAIDRELQPAADRFIQKVSQMV